MPVGKFTLTNSARVRTPGDILVMVAGLTQTQNTGYDNGDGTVNQMGSLTPDVFDGVVIHRVRKDNSGLNVTMFQTNPGDLGSDFWTSILFTGAGSWNDFEVFSADTGSFADNNGSASWNGLPDAGAFINTFTYNLEWFK